LNLNKSQSSVKKNTLITQGVFIDIKKYYFLCLETIFTLLLNFPEAAITGLVGSVL
jgi:hypothetical protein